MELIAYILYLIASRSFIFLILAIFLIIGRYSILRILSRSGSGDELTLDDKPGSEPTVEPKPRSYLRFAVSTVIFGMAALALINFIFPHFVDGELMNAYGKRTAGKVVKVTETSSRHNNNRVMRHDVIYKDENGNNIETSFQTWDFNIYPSSNTTRYPQLGDEFEVLYLPSFPTAFLIATDGKSPHAKATACNDLIKALESAKIKHDFDPKDPKFKSALDEAAKKVLDAKCGTN